MFSCAVEGCRNSVEFIFPSNEERKRKWLEAIRRPNYVPKKRHGLCSLHFTADHFIHESRDGGFINSRRILRKDAVPCIFMWSVAESQCEQTNYEMRPVISEHLSRIRFDVPIKEEDENVDNMLGNVEFGLTMDIKTNICSNQAEPEITIKHEPLWDYDSPKNEKHTSEEYVSTSTQTPRSFASMSIENFCNRPDAVSYYTGFESFTKFRTVLQSLGKKAYRLHYLDCQAMNVNVADQLFMTLWKLKRNCTDFELSINFNVSEGTISSIIYTWIKFMAEQWSKLNTWPSEKLVEYCMPQSFRSSFLSSKIISNETEIHTEKLHYSRTHQSAFRTYKCRNMSRALAVATSRGLLSHCSLAYGRPNTNQQIKCNSLLDEFDLGDSIIIDTGFNLQDIFPPKDVKINVPTCVNIESNWSAKAVSHDRKLSKHRVHIERVFGLACTYKILDSTLDHHYMPIASEILSVIFMLCNFREGIR